MEPGALSGLAIAVGFVIGVVLIVNIAFAIPELRQRLGNWLYHSGKADIFDKILLTPLWLVLGILEIFVMLLGGLLALTLLKDFRKWWHRK